jgi:uncharacterized repeat protein (TIGR01451 family)
MGTWMNRNHSRHINTHYRAGIPSTLIFCACALLLPGRCFADDVSVTIADPSQTATPGQTVDFTGTITNDIEDTADFTLSFSGFDSSNLTPNSLLSSPFSIGEGASTSTIDLFSVTLNSTIAPGTYPVDFLLQGRGSDPPNEIRDADGEVTITAVTPEPSTMWLVAIGLITFATTLPEFIRKKSKQAA